MFFLGSGRATATIGEGSTVFPGKTVWSGPFRRASDIPVAVPAGAWLTAFEDDASPRPGVDELWLEPAKDQTPVKPPPHEIHIRNQIPIPLDLIAIVGAIGYLLVRRARPRAK